MARTSSIVMALARYRTDLPRLSQCGWLAEFDITHESFDGGESSVAGRRAVAALILDVSEEVEN